MNATGFRSNGANQHEPCMWIAVQIPDDAAKRLRQLATEGPAKPLWTLGIRAIQLKSDSIISLHVSGQAPEKILLENSANGNDRSEKHLCKIENSYANFNNGAKTENSNNILDSSSTVKQSPNIGFFQLPQVHQQQHLKNANIPTNIDTSGGVSGDCGNIMFGGPSTSSVVIKQKLGADNNKIFCNPNQPIFKYPNTVCPMEGKIPKPPNMQMCTSNNLNVREFPFESMRQARVLQGRDNALNAVAGTSDGLLPVAENSISALPRLQDQHLVNTLKNMAMSSPLLVNLLQNDSSPSISATLPGSQVKPLPLPQNLPQVALLQRSPLLEIISPNVQQQHQIISSPMRSTSTPNNDFIILQQQPKHILTNGNNVPDIVLNVPSSPKANVLQQHTQQSQEQIILSPTNNNSLYSQQQQRVLQQEPQQLTQFSFQQQQHEVIADRHSRVSVIGSGNINHQFHSPLQTHRIIGTQQQQQHICSPYINPRQHPQELLSLPSTTPVQSPNNQQLPQAAQKLPHSSASSALLHNPANMQPQTVSLYPSSLAVKSNYNSLPLSPEYMVYIQRQLQNQQQQTQLSYISEMNNSLLRTTNPQHQHFISETITAASASASCSGICDDRQKANGATNDSLDDLPLLNLSDLDGLIANDLDALLPTCDIDTLLSLDDKNELELLLQDAKDLDLDMIEENLFAVGMDINETASSLLGSDVEMPPNVILDMDHVAETEAQKQRQQAITSEQIFQTQQQWQKSHRHQQQVHNQAMVSQLTRQHKQELPISKEHLHKLSEVQQQIQVKDNLVPQNGQQFLVESNRPQHYQLLKIQSNWINGITPTSISKAINNSKISTVTAVATLSNSTNTNSINLTISSTTNSSTHSIQPKQFLINPLSGELEPSVSDNDNSETEAEQETKKQKLSSNVALLQKNNNDSLNYNSDNHAAYKTGIKLDNPTNQLSITDQTEMTSATLFPLTTTGLGMTEKIKNLNFTTKTKLQKRKKLSKIMTTMCNRLGDEGAKGSPRLTITSQSLFNHNSHVLTDNNNVTTTASNKSSSLLRKKLQQGLKEKKNKDVNAKSITTLLKTKRKRTKTSNKYNKSNLTIIVTTSDLTTAKNNAITNSSATITTLTASTGTIETSSITSISGGVSSARSFDSNPVNSVEMSAEKIKLRLKLGKSESGSPPYKIEMNLRTSRESNQKQRLHMNAHILKSTVLQKQHQQQQSQMFTNKTQIMKDHLQKQLLNNFTTSCPTTVGTKATTTTEDEPRVPPLHISLKGGKNSIVIKNTHKEGKKGHSSSYPYETKTAEDDGTTKRKIQFKRNHVFSIPTCSSTNSYLEESDFVNKHSDILNSRVTPTSFVNRAPSSFHNKPTKVASSHVSSTLLAGKNGFTISTLESTKNQYLKDNNTTMSSSTYNTLGSTSVGTIISHKATNTQPQLTKITTLPNSITLNTKTTNESRGLPLMKSPNSIGDSNEHNLKKTSTITPLGCKIHEQSYLTTVRKQQLSLNEKQTQQQMIAAAVTMLPSATTLKRVEITEVEGKYSSGKIIEHTLLKPNEATVSTTAVKPVTQIHNYNPLVITNTTTPPINNHQNNRNENVCDKYDKLKKCTSVYSNKSITTSSGINEVNLRDTVLGRRCSNIIREKPMAQALTGGGNGNGNGAAEDSGIESMDALSEKSHHQAASCSPQPTLHTRLPLDEKFDNQITSKAVREEFKECKSASMLTNSLDVLNSNQISIADDEIEKALAKMEGFIEDKTSMREEQIATTMVPIVIDKSDLNFTNKSEKLKINSKYNVLLLDDHIKSDFYNGVLEKGDDDNDDLIKNLTTRILEKCQEKLSVKTSFHEAKVTTYRTKENTIPIHRTNHETQANKRDSEITNTNKMDVLINLDDNETNKGPATAIYNNNNNKIMEKRLERHLDGFGEIKKIQRKKINTSELMENREKCNMGSMANGLYPISIGDIDLPRVRTRARSRLNAPLDSLTKDGPPSVYAEIGNNADLKQVTMKHVITNLSTVHSDCISVRPKTNGVKTVTAAATTPVAVTSLHNNIKRKRPESDLFTSHGESEIKRSYSGYKVGFNIALNGENSNASNNRKIADTYKRNVKIEESSDSDEPLIEIAGKARISKVTNATIPNHITISMDTNAKLSCSGRTFQQQNTVIAENFSLPPSTNVSNTERGEMCGKPSTMYIGNGNGGSILHARETMLFAAAHLTRGVAHSIQSVSPNNNSSATYSNSNTNCCNATNDIEKINARRSVRTSAATNKIAIIRNGNSNGENSAIFTHSNNTDISRNAVTAFPKNCATAPESMSEARRKTRSTIGIGESILSEGQRRRSSKDQK